MAFLLLLQIGLFWQNKWCSMGENAFHMAFQERWVFSHSSPNPALAATRLWAGYGELVGENSISPGKPCEMHILCWNKWRSLIVAIDAGTNGALWLLLLMLEQMALFDCYYWCLNKWRSLIVTIDAWEQMALFDCCYWCWNIMLEQMALFDCYYDAGTNGALWLFLLMLEHYAGTLCCSNKC